MFTRTIEHAVNNTLGPRVDDANATMRSGIHTANEHAAMARQEFIAQLEFGTYVIAGAILTGFLVLAIFARAGN